MNNNDILMENDAIRSKILMNCCSPFPVPFYVELWRIICTDELVTLLHRSDSLIIDPNKMFVQLTRNKHKFRVNKCRSKNYFIS